MRLDQQRLNKVGAKRALNSLCLLQQDPCLFIIIIRSWQEAQQPGTHRPRVGGFPTLQFWNLLGNCTPKSYSHNAASYFPLLKISIIYVYTNGKLHPPISFPYLVVNFMKLSSGCLALKEAKRIITDGLRWRGMTVWLHLRKVWATQRKTHAYKNNIKFDRGKFQFTECWALLETPRVLNNHLPLGEMWDKLKLQVLFLHCEGLRGRERRKTIKVLLFSSSLFEFLVK